MRAWRNGLQRGCRSSSRPERHRSTALHRSLNERVEILHRSETMPRLSLILVSACVLAGNSCVAHQSAPSSAALGNQLSSSTRSTAAQPTTEAPTGFPARCDPAEVQVMLLGTYHFANPGRDAVKQKVDDVLA